MKDLTWTQNKPGWTHKYTVCFKVWVSESEFRLFRNKIKYRTCSRWYHWVQSNYRCFDMFLNLLFYCVYKIYTLKWPRLHGPWKVRSDVLSWAMIRNDFRFKGQELLIDVQFHRRWLDQIRLDSLKLLLVHVTWIQLLRFRFHQGPWKVV